VSFIKRLFIFILILFGMILFGGLLPVVAQSRPVSPLNGVPDPRAGFTVPCNNYDSIQRLRAFDSKISPNILSISADFDKASRKTSGQAWSL